MQSRFGLKDFVVLVGLGLVIVILWLGMVQDDRKWNELMASQARMQEMQTSLARIQQQLDRGLVAAPAGGSGVSGGDSSAGPPAWARPGVPVTSTGPWDFTTDPYGQEGFSAGGQFTEIFEGQPSKITPYTYADVYGRRVNDVVCESLGWYDPETLEMRGRLAEAWQYDPDGEWLRVKIRDNARFSTGEPVLAEDVRWTYEDLLFNPEIEAERFRSVYNAIERIEVLGDPETSRVLEFTFKEPRYDSLDQAFGFKVLPKSVYEAWTESPAAYNQSTGLLVGSGPFRLERVGIGEQWAPPSDVVLVRNEFYWGPRPPLASLRFRSIQDSLARLTAFESGQGDMMRPTGAQYEIKSQDDRFAERFDAKMWYNMRGGYAFIAWQCGPRNGERLTPFADKRVRQAMTMLIDRDRVIRDIGKGLVRPATGPFLSSTPQANPDIEPWPYDRDRALALLREAGWRDRDGDGVLEDERGRPFRFEITFGQGSESTLQMVTFLQQSLAESGIRMDLRPIDWSVLQSTLNARDFDAITFAWSASSPESDPEQIWHSKSIENQGDNFIQWSSPEADRWIEEGRRLLDNAERMRAWHRLHEVFHEEQPYTFIYEMPWLRFTTKRSKNLQEYASGLEYHEFWVAPGGANAAPGF
jgi:peptide/nickel transport system substrate-binding protein